MTALLSAILFASAYSAIPLFRYSVYSAIPLFRIPCFEDSQLTNNNDHI